MSSELVPLLNSNRGDNINGEIRPVATDKLPSYTESQGHIIVSVNMPTPPPYPTYVNNTGGNQSAYIKQEYPAGQIFAFGICMLFGAVILYAFKHGL
jgi:hypothetical protein